jgi:hypothetical protein
LLLDLLFNAFNCALLNVFKLGNGLILHVLGSDAAAVVVVDFIEVVVGNVHWARDGDSTFLETFVQLSRLIYDLLIMCCCFFLHLRKLAFAQLQLKFFLRESQTQFLFEP